MTELKESTTEIKCKQQNRKCSYEMLLFTIPHCTDCQSWKQLQWLSDNVNTPRAKSQDQQINYRAAKRRLTTNITNHIFFNIRYQFQQHAGFIFPRSEMIDFVSFLKFNLWWQWDVWNRFSHNLPVSACEKWWWKCHANRYWNMMQPMIGDVVTPVEVRFWKMSRIVK